MTKCFICRDDKATSYYQRKRICLNCFRRIKNKTYTSEYQKELGFEVTNYYIKHKYSWLDKLARKKNE